ncbi:MAG: hypothetical protein AAFY60_13750, partial [Myxococcota bacterium]
MGGGSLDFDELDAALDGLSQKKAAEGEAETPEGAPEAPDASAGPPPLQPPPPPRRPPRRASSKDPSQLPDSWGGRTNYDDLFVVDTGSLPSARGGLEEKVEYFREKLKRSEAMTARFREAWQTRDSELDILEALMERERGKAEESAHSNAELNQKLTQLNQFIEEKKTQFETYGQKVQAAFEQKEQQEQELRSELEASYGKMEAALDEKDSEIAGVSNQLEALKQEYEDEQRRHLEDNEAYNGQIAERDQRITDGEQRYADLAGELEGTRQELLDTRDTFERDVAVRNEAIEKLKGTIET